MPQYMRGMSSQEDPFTAAVSPVAPIVLPGREQVTREVFFMPRAEFGTDPMLIHDLKSTDTYEFEVHIIPTDEKCAILGGVAGSLEEAPSIYSLGHKSSYVVSEVALTALRENRAVFLLDNDIDNQRRHFDEQR